MGKAVAFQQEMTLHGMLFTPVVMIVSVQVYLLESVNMLTITVVSQKNTYGRSTFRGRGVGALGFPHLTMNEHHVTFTAIRFQIIGQTIMYNNKATSGIKVKA